MDVLTKEKTKTYDYTCRYSPNSYYYHKLDNKWVYGLGSNVSKDITWVAHKVLPTDTLDFLALKYYNNPTLYWAIAYFNDIEDVYINLLDYFDIIKIPNITSITFDGDR